MVLANGCLVCSDKLSANFCTTSLPSTRIVKSFQSSNLRPQIDGEFRFITEGGYLHTGTVLVTRGAQEVDKLYDC